MPKTRFGLSGSEVRRCRGKPLLEVLETKLQNIPEQQQQTQSFESLPRYVSIPTGRSEPSLWQMDGVPISGLSLISCVTLGSF